MLHWRAESAILIKGLKVVVKLLDMCRVVVVLKNTLSKRRNDQESTIK